MKIMLLLAFAVVAALLCQPREGKSLTMAQAWVVVAVASESGALAAGLALGGHV
jgi:hypothetical protein